MASHTRVLNVTTGDRPKRSQAMRRIEQCLSEWVPGRERFEIRDLSPDERIIKRATKSNEELKEEAKTIFLPASEIRHLIYEPPTGQQAAHRESRRLAFEAQKFAGACA